MKRKNPLKTRNAVAHRVIIQEDIYRELKRIEAETDEKPYDQINRILHEWLKNQPKRKK